MLRITFSPPGVEPRTFEMTDATEDLGALEAELIEDSGGKQWATFMEWSLLMSQGSLRSVRVLLWVLMRRENPGLKLEEFDFPVTALQVEETDDENPEQPAPPEGEPVGKGEPDESGTSSP